MRSVDHRPRTAIMIVWNNVLKWHQSLEAAAKVSVSSHANRQMPTSRSPMSAVSPQVSQREKAEASRIWDAIFHEYVIDETKLAASIDKSRIVSMYNSGPTH